VGEDVIANHVNHLPTIFLIDGCRLQGLSHKALDSVSTMSTIFFNKCRRNWLLLPCIGVTGDFLTFWNRWLTDHKNGLNPYWAWSVAVNHLLKRWLTNQGAPH